MPAASYAQTDFSGGRWSPFNLGRFDHPKYRKSLAESRNAIGMDTAAWTRRSGTRHLATTRSGKPGRVIPFSFENFLPYVLEFTDGYIRAFDGTSLVLDGEVFAVTNISTTSPAVVTISGSLTAFDWAIGDQVQFTLLDGTAQAAMPTLIDRQFQISSLSSTTFALFTPNSGNPVDGSTLGWTTGLNVNVSRVMTLASPYTGGDWATVRAVQDEELMVLLQGKTPPQVVTVPVPFSGNFKKTSTVSQAIQQFQIEPALFEDGPYNDPIPDTNITPGQTSGIVTLSVAVNAYSATQAYKTGDYVNYISSVWVSITDNNAGNTPSNGAYWQVVDQGPGVTIRPGGFVAGDIGRHVRLFSEPPLWQVGTGNNYTAGQVVKFNGAYWTALESLTGVSPSQGSIDPNQPGNLTTTWAANPSGAQWSWGKIVSVNPNATVIAPSGVYYGDMTAGGGLATGFNGTTDVSYSQGPYKAPANTTLSGAVTTAFIGEFYASAPGTVTYAVIYPTLLPNGNYGFINSHAAVSFYITSSSSQPTSAAFTGTSLFVVPDGSNWPYPVVIAFSSSNNYITVNIDAPDNSEGGISVSEVQLYSSSGLGGAPGASINVQLFGVPLLYLNDIVTWQLGTYNAPDGTWPTCGCYYEGRLYLAGAIPNRFDCSVSNDVFNFAYSDQYNNIADNAAISYILNDSELNDIYWMMPDAQGIVCGTVGGEVLIAAPTTGPITPTNIAAHRITKYGSANIEPRRTGLTTVFTQRYQRKLIEYVADAFSGKYAGPNLAEMARDLCSTGIAEIAYQEELMPMVWSRMNDGSFANMVYKRTSLITSNPPELLGWHRHDHGAGRLLKSICVGPAPDNLLDALTMVTFDPISSQYHVEVLNDIFDEENTIFDAQMLDGSITPTFGTSANGGCTFYGLWHLNGKTVTVWAGGLDCGDWPVSNGAVTVPYGAVTQPLFTQRYLQQLSAQGIDFVAPTCNIDNGAAIVPVLVGFTYISQGQMLRPVAPDATGARTGPALGKKRRTHKLAMLLHNTQGLSIGTHFDKLDPVIFKTREGEGMRVYSPVELYSGVIVKTLQDDSSYSSQVAWEIDRPYPATVLALEPFIETAD